MTKLQLEAALEQHRLQILARLCTSQATNDRNHLLAQRNDTVSARPVRPKRKNITATAALAQLDLYQIHRLSLSQNRRLKIRKRRDRLSLIGFGHLITGNNGSRRRRGIIPFHIQPPFIGKNCNPEQRLER